MIFSRKKELKKLREEMDGLREKLQGHFFYIEKLIAANDKKIDEWCRGMEKKSEDHYAKTKQAETDRKVEHDKHIDNMEHHAVQVERYLDNQTKFLSIMVDRLK